MEENSIIIIVRNKYYLLNEFVISNCIGNFQSVEEGSEINHSNLSSVKRKRFIDKLIIINNLLASWNLRCGHCTLYTVHRWTLVSCFKLYYCCLSSVLNNIRKEMEKLHNFRINLCSTKFGAENISKYCRTETTTSDYYNSQISLTIITFCLTFHNRIWNGSE